MRKNPLSGKRILLIEDDAGFSQHLCVALEKENCRVESAISYDQAMKAIAMSTKHYDAAVVDLWLPKDGYHLDSPQSSIGVDIARILKRRNPRIPIIGTSVLMDESGASHITSDFDAFLPKKLLGIGQEHKLIDTLEYFLSGSVKRQPRIFIVHGHDKIATEQLTTLLAKEYGFSDSIILGKAASGSRTIIEKFEDHADILDLVFVLLTPDDIAFNRRKPRIKEPRARQNVIFELGFFYAKLQRRSGSIILLRKGDVAIPSDIQGIEYIDITSGIINAKDKITAELQRLKWI